MIGVNYSQEHEIPEKNRNENKRWKKRAACNGTIHRGSGPNGKKKKGQIAFA